MSPAGFLSLATTIAYLVLGLSLALAIVRLLRGPTDADRVVALDLIAFLTIGYGAVSAADSRRGEFLDVGLVLALVAFVGTVALARYLERSDRSVDSAFGKTNEEAS